MQHSEVQFPNFAAMRCIHVLILVPLVVFSSCGEPEPRNTPIIGQFNERTFVHEELGLAWEIPEAWRIVSEEELRERQAISAEEMRSKISDIGTRKSVFQPFLALEPYATEDSSYVTILLMAERLENVPGINNAYDYFNQNMATLQSQDPTAYPRYEFSDIKNVQLAGKPALRQGAMIHPNADEVQPMENVVIKRGEYLLVAQVANFDSVEELVLAHDLLDTIKWENR